VSIRCGWKGRSALPRGAIFLVGDFLETSGRFHHANRDRAAVGAERAQPLSVRKSLRAALGAGGEETAAVSGRDHRERNRRLALGDDKGVAVRVAVDCEPLVAHVRVSVFR
jgi:hypothetical protein